MNHFPFHIGDYAEATGHLSFAEDATYFRCIRKYYSTEKPLPVEISQVQRLIGAKTKEEKNSVEVVLKEFFILECDGWHNKRCDEELEKFKKIKKSLWYYQLSKPEKAEIQARRSASKLSATPGWLTKAQKIEISDIYVSSAILTASTGVKHEVDHIVPIRSKVVCGLHVPWNLRVITAHKNKIKSNLLLEI